MTDVWEIPFLSTVSLERTGYPSQKPEALLERIVQASSQPDDVVAFGAAVTVDDGTGAVQRYTIVGEDEADPDVGLVSWVSPLSRVLEGARVGDRVVWRRPAGSLELVITGIDYIRRPTA